jgi:hypothetical protein
VRKYFVGLFVALAALLAASAPAHAAGLEFGMEDEGLLLSNQQFAPDAVNAWQQMGVDVVRLQARWWVIAPAGSSKKMPSGFHPSDPSDPRYDWHSLDLAIAMVRGTGMKVMLSITGPGPLWTSSKPSKKNPRWMPKASAYRDFAKAVATRYKDSVDRYLLWNEPNQKGWLQPQWEKKGRTWVAVSPHIYRSLVRAAYPVIKKADPHSEVVIGELAPIGNRAISSMTPMKPLPFLRSFGCVDSRYHSIRSGRCKHFKAARGDTLGYHPHPKKLAPDKVNKDRDDAQFADLRRVFSALDKLRHRHRLRISSNIRLTEFGYETSPPDKASGVSTAKQARYLQQASYLAWKYKRVRGLSFYQWDDERTQNLGKGTKRYSGWQTGLRFNDGKPKPALSVTPAPFVIDKTAKSSRAVLWGQVRPAADRRVTIQMRKKGSKTWTNVVAVSTVTDGLWSRKMKVNKTASYRYEWTPAATLTDPHPAARTSGTVDLAKKEKTRYHASKPF